MSSWSGISESPGTMQAVLNGFTRTSPCISQLSCAFLLQRNAPLPSDPSPSTHVLSTFLLCSCSFLPLLYLLIISLFAQTNFLKFCWTAYHSQVGSCALAKVFTSALDPIQIWWDVRVRPRWESLFYWHSGANCQSLSDCIVAWGIIVIVLYNNCDRYVQFWLHYTTHRSHPGQTSKLFWVAGWTGWPPEVIPNAKYSVIFIRPISVMHLRSRCCKPKKLVSVVESGSYRSLTSWKIEGS